VVVVPIDQNQNHKLNLNLSLRLKDKKKRRIKPDTLHPIHPSALSTISRLHPIRLTNSNTSNTPLPPHLIQRKRMTRKKRTMMLKGEMEVPI
jgi:hypothetical protein